MSEQTYSDHPLRTHGRIVAVPVAMAVGMALGVASRIEPFYSNQSVFGIGLAVTLALTIAYFLFEAQTNERALRVNERTVSFQSHGSPTTLFWPEVFDITCESVQIQGKDDWSEPRVIVHARRTGTVGQDFERYVVDFNYGLTPGALCQALKEHWNNAAEQTRRDAATPAQRGPMQQRTGFGRRSSDRRSSVA